MPKKIKISKLKRLSFKELKAFLDEPSTTTRDRLAKTFHARPGSVYKWRYQGVPFKFWLQMHEQFKIPLHDLLVLHLKITKRK